MLSSLKSAALHSAYNSLYYSQQQVPSLSRILQFSYSGEASFKLLYAFTSILTYYRSSAVATVCDKVISCVSNFVCVCMCVRVCLALHYSCTDVEIRYSPLTRPVAVNTTSPKCRRNADENGNTKLGALYALTVTLKSKNQRRSMSQSFKFIECTTQRL